MDGGALQPRSEGDFVVDGVAVCDSCAAQWPIAGGVLDLLDPLALDHESSRELERRDVTWAEVRAAQQPLTDMDRVELDSHLAALGLTSTHVVLEFGCGLGRFTGALSRGSARVVAVDFSMAGLLGVSALVGDNVALVRADVARLRTADRSFDRALSTLTSNLPTQAARHALFRVAAAALHERGRFVFGVHFFGLRARIEGVHKEGYYNEDGIYRLYMTRSDCRQMAGPYFRKLDLRPVVVIPPFSRTLRLPFYATSRFCERIPLLADFGELLMGVADRPMHGS
jgi:SAM-dependent methyltransferase